MPELAMTWLVIHPINEKSPLFDLSQEALGQADFALVATIRGLDETVSQTIHSIHTYTFDDIKWNHRFVDLYRKTDSANGPSIDPMRGKPCRSGQGQERGRRKPSLFRTESVGRLSIGPTEKAAQQHRACRARFH